MRNESRLMKLIRFFSVFYIALISVLLTMLSGCVHRQFVSEPYPRWGEEATTRTAEISAPLLRVLYPANPAQAQACVLLVHGMNEHIGRYDKAAQYLAKQFVVAGFDFYAHGLSNPVLQQADRLLADGAATIEVSDAYLAQSRLSDLEPMRQSLQHAMKQTMALCDEERQMSRPVFIVSHSLGALVTASYLLQVQHEDALIDRIGGVVFLGPAFAVSEPPSWLGWVANPVIKLSFHAKTHFLHPQDEPLPLLIANQLLALVTVPLLDGLFEMLSWPGVRAVLSPVSPRWVTDYLTDSEAEKNMLRADGWIVRRTLLRFVKGIETEMVHFRRHMREFKMPYLLIASENDPITPAWGGKDFAEATLLHHPDNALLVLPGLRYHQHLFLDEPMHTELLAHISQWITLRLHASP